MSQPQDAGSWFGHTVEAGASAVVSAVLSETYSGAEVSVPMLVWRGRRDGPTVSVTAAVHGDEINGTGAIRRIIHERPFDLAAGTLVLVPVVNVLGFERHARYLPDRRDLNRSFPGSADGSLSSRMAHSFFERVIRRCDYGIDLHTAAVRRTNFPNVRADMSNARLAAFARAFGSALVVDGKGPKGSLRRSACKAGCLTFILEAGEVWKAEPGIVAYAMRGVANCLKYLHMVEGEPNPPRYRIETDATKWGRAPRGGFLEFHTSPGVVVEKGDAIATISDLVGDESETVHAPRDGVVLGMTTIPSIAPGDAICHLAFPRRGVLAKVGKLVDRLGEDPLHETIRDHLATNVSVTPSDETEP